MSETNVIKEIISDLMEGDIEEDVWDLAPGIFFVLNPEPDDPDRHRVALFEIPDVFWQLNPDTVLGIQRLADAIADPEMPKPPIPFEDGDAFVGIITRTEGWSLQSKDPEQIAEYTAWAKEGKRLVDHPDARELKTYLGVDGTNLFALSHVRRDPAPSDWSEGNHEGRLVEATKALLAAMRFKFEGIPLE